MLTNFFGSGHPERKAPSSIRRERVGRLLACESLESRRLLAAVGVRDLLYVRVQFSDQKSAPETLVTSAQMTQNATEYLQKWSGNQLTFTITIKDVGLPKPTTAYSGSSGRQAIANEALAVLQAQGVHAKDFEHRCFRFNGVMSGGVANHSNTAWIGTSSWSTLLHELGHTLGLYHSHFWNPTDNTNPFGKGTTITRGDPFTRMGTSQLREWNAHQKWVLGHIGGDQVHAIDPRVNGTTQITLSSHENLPSFASSDVYLVRIPFSKEAVYVEYRVSAGGVLIHRGDAARPAGVLLLDGNPATETAADAALKNGQSFTARYGVGVNDVFRITVNAVPGSKAVISVMVGDTSTPPTSVTGIPSAGRVSLSWAAPAYAGVSAITDYVIQHSANNGRSWTTFNDGVSATRSATVTGLTNGVGYVFRVAGMNSAGLGSYSAASAVTVPRTVATPPTSVTGIPSAGRVSLSWATPASTGGSAITDYVIQYSSNNGTNWTTFNDAISALRSATITGLTNGVAYIFRLAAKNAAGIGAYSSVSAPVVPGLAPGEIQNSAIPGRGHKQFQDGKLREVWANRSGAWIDLTVISSTLQESVISGRSHIQYQNGRLREVFGTKAGEWIDLTIISSTLQESSISGRSHIQYQNGRLREVFGTKVGEWITIRR